MKKSFTEMKAEVEVVRGTIEGVEVLSKGDKNLGFNRGYLVKIKKPLDTENAIIQYMFIFPAAAME